MLRSQWVLASVRRLSTRPMPMVPRCAIGATILITPTDAHPTDTTVLAGSLAASSSAPARGTTGAGAVDLAMAATAIAVDTDIAVDTADAGFITVESAPMVAQLTATPV